MNRFFVFILFAFSASLSASNAFGRANVLGTFQIRIFRDSCSHTLSLDGESPGEALSKDGVLYLGENTQPASERILVYYLARNPKFKELLADLKNGILTVLENADKPVVGLQLSATPKNVQGTYRLEGTVKGKDHSEERFSLTLSTREWAAYQKPGSEFRFSSTAEDTHSIAYPYLLQLHKYIDDFQEKNPLRNDIGIRLVGGARVTPADEFSGLYEVQSLKENKIELSKNELKIEFTLEITGVGAHFQLQRKHRRR